MSLRKQPRPAVEHIPAEVVDAVPAPAVLSWPGLILGAGHGQPICAGREQSVLVLGPPRSGKTTALVVPNVLAAPGAVVATSTKTDIVDLTVKARSRRGRCWLFDPSGTVAIPEGVTRLCWSPVGGAADWETAVATAHVMARAARPGRGVTDSDHWAERAEALIAPLLHATALAGLDVSWVLRWVLRRELKEPATMIARRSGNEFAGETLAGIAETEERERSGIFSSAAGVLSAYRSPAALSVAEKANFDIDAFVSSSDTVYVCAPGDAQEQLAPVVVTLLDRIRHATYRRQPGPPPVVWALDEAANIAPLPSLPAVVSEGASQGLVSLVCLQDLSQARVRWGAAADGFLTLFSWKVILAGVADYHTLRLVSALGGDVDVQYQSHTRPAMPLLAAIAAFGKDRAPNTNTITTSWQRRPVLPPNAINQQPPGTALLLGPNRPPERLRLVTCFDHPWRNHLP